MVTFSRPIIVIAGSTASGKSNIAIKLAKDINGVIINADSRQIYKELSIGTARPSLKETNEVPHFLYGHISVKENYSIYKYQKDVQKVLESLLVNQTPILVGGTGLYIDSIIFNYSLKKEEIDTKRRKQLSNLSVKELKELINPDILNSLNESDRDNPIRLIRLIEKGKKNEQRGKELTHKYFVLDLPRDELNKKIEERVKRMIEEGLVEENTEIRKENLGKHLALKTIGYQEFDEYFKGKKSLKEVEEEIIKNTCKYAKRQRTWFRKHKDALWSSNYNLILEESVKLIKTS
ncbi:MAG: tRNA (adenosine(37)-N6)-dimethylallyltransferase MiaA [Candidatus Dojkabacteria bacterium]|jgi:tRNA dimethylallyltransferase|nr:tRNA (adenosine(37)-N6)-dimethylallyltransferase MiaA [Candidatus Dojkabacteria bacterium]MDD4561311.1 tRNA (adenosine(37)-N6)-dimethylallyltransferase MiaA [Candidatus Dojkabacteria bacterium]NLB12357.1 tRNA (adenosine(37)-N6)-dimethylallyltransferase MiaA [Candidatus Dojkabacteria bacterium]